MSCIPNMSYDCFNQLFIAVAVLFVNIPFYCNLWHFVLVSLLLTCWSRVIMKFLVDPSWRQVGHPWCTAYLICVLFDLEVMTRRKENYNIIGLMWRSFWSNFPSRYRTTCLFFRYHRSNITKFSFCFIRNRFLYCWTQCRLNMSYGLTLQYLHCIVCGIFFELLEFCPK